MALKNKGLICLAVIGSCFLLAFLAFSSWLNSTQLEKAVSQTLSQNLGHQVTIGEIRPALFNRVSVKNIEINLQGEGKPFVKAQEIRIHYSWWVLLTNFKHFAQGVEKIDFIEPQIYLERDQKGQWNYEKLFPQKNKKKEPLSQDYLAQLEVWGGEIFLQDKQKKIKDLHLTKVQGLLNLKNNPELAFRGTGYEGQSGILVQGLVNLAAQKIDCQLQVKDFSVASWHAYLPQRPYLTATSGKADAKLKVWGYYPDGLSYHGKALIKDGKIKSNSVPLPITKVNGEIQLTSDQVSLKRLQGLLGQTPVQLSGNIYLGPKTLLNLSLQSSDIMVEEISQKWISQLKKIKRQGVLRGQINFLGPVDDIQAQGQFFLTKGQVYDQRVENLELVLAYQDNQVRVEKAQTLWQGGKLKGQGLVEWKNKKVDYNFTLLADNLPVNSLPLQNKQLADLSGKLKGQLLISSLNNSLKVGGFVQLNGGSWRKLDFSQAKAHFLWEKGGLDLKYLIVDGPGIAGKVAGRIDSDQQIDLQVNVPILQLKKVAAAFSPQLDLKGKGSFTGRVTGTTKSPLLEGDFKAYQGRLMQQEFEELTGKISWAENKLNLLDIEMREGITQHTLQGQILLAEEPIFNLSLQSKETRVEKLLRLVDCQQVDLKGRVNSLLTIQGPVGNLKIQGAMDVTKGSWRDEQLDRAKIKFHWQDNLLHLDQMEAQQNNTFLTGQGWMKKNGEGEIILNVREVDLEKVPYLRYKLPPGSKTVNLLGKVRFNAQKELQLTPLIIVHGGNSYRLTGRVNLGKLHPTMDLIMNIERGDLTILSALIPSEFPHHITGKLQGKVNLWGRLDNPNSRAMINLKQASVGEYPIEQGKMDLVWQDGKLQILQFKLTKGQGFLAAQGSLDFQGEAQVDLVAQGLEGDLLSALFSLPEKVQGIVNLSAQIRGKTASPRIACSLDVNQGKVRETSFDRLYGLAIWENGLADLQQLILKKDKYQLVAKGKIPTDPESSQRINLKVKMEQGDLGLLTIFLDKQIAWAQGGAQAWLEVGGTLKAPLVNGEIRVEQGKIKPNALQEPLENLEARVLFHQDGLELEYLRGSLGGGSFQASGRGDNLFSSLSKLDFQIKANKVKPKLKIFQGLVSGELFLEGSTSSPLLRGQINVAKGMANIPLTMGAGPGLQGGLRLDIGVNIGDNLKVKAAIADLLLRGGVHLGGTLGNPQLNGTVTSKKGTINYLGTKFRLTKGVIEFKGKDGIMPDLNLTGKTRYKKTSITLQVTGKPTDIKAHFTSDPPLSESEIIFLLTLGGGIKLGEGETSVGSVHLDSQLIRIAGESIPLAFLEGLENTLGNSLGLDEFYISQDIWKGPQLILGKYLWDEKMYINYTLNTHVEQDKNTLEQEEKWYFEVQYKLKPNLNLSYSRNSLGDNQIMLSTSISF